MPVYFSIIIPMFNRARLISRAVSSCLAQNYQDFEIVAVDDCSVDNTVNIVREFGDERIVVLCHEENRGVGPARNTGIRHARGEWIIFLDSDDELLPGALQLIFEKTQTVKNNISRLAFMYRVDTGGMSPFPSLTEEEIWDYRGYICWASYPRKMSDYFNVIRKNALVKIKFPETRALETLFHLNFARAFATKCCATVVAILHTDADNRSLAFSATQLLRDSKFNMDQIDAVLSEHGNSLRNIRPPLYYEYIRGGATFSFLAGKRVKGLGYAFRYLTQKPFSIKTWVVILVGLLGRNPLAWVKTKISS